MRAGIYARVSSDQQAEQQTIQSQISALRERVEADGHSLPEQLCFLPEQLCFLDDGLSGATLTRPALEKLRDTAYAGGLQKLYVHSPDRLARKYAWQVLLVDELHSHGVEIVFLDHTMGASPEEDLLLQMQGLFAEYDAPGTTPEAADLPALAIAFTQQVTSLSGCTKQSPKTPLPYVRPPDRHSFRELFLTKRLTISGDRSKKHRRPAGALNPPAAARRQRAFTVRHCLLLNSRQAITRLSWLSPPQADGMPLRGSQPLDLPAVPGSDHRTGSGGRPLGNSPRRPR